MQQGASKGRDARTERIGTELLEAARQQFLADGYHGATLDKIAAAAGYTKGVVYSRFRSKAELFLALLEDRIRARAEENRALARGLTGTAGLEQLARRWTEVQREDLAWTLLVVEFRVHAARDPEVAARYNALHERTLEGIAGVIGAVLVGEASTAADRRRVRRLAQVLHSYGNGAALEQAADPSAFPAALVAQTTRAVVEGVR